MKNKPVLLSVSLPALSAAVVLALSGCIHWPREPYADALAAPPGPVRTQLKARFPGAQIIGPVYRLHRDGRRGYRVESQYFLFKDAGGQTHRGEVDANARLTARPVGLVDKLPPRLHERFFQADAAPAPRGRLVGQAWVFTDNEPTYEFEFQSSAGRGIGRINESATAVRSYMLRPPSRE